MGRLSNPIQRLILQLGALRSSQLRLLSQSQQIWFQAFIYTSVFTEHQRCSWSGAVEHVPPRWFLRKNLLEVIYWLLHGKTLIRGWKRQCRGSWVKWRSWWRMAPIYWAGFLLLVAYLNPPLLPLTKSDFAQMLHLPHGNDCPTLWRKHTAIIANGRHVLQKTPAGIPLRMKLVQQSSGEAWYSNKYIWSLSPVPGTELLKPLAFPTRSVLLVTRSPLLSHLSWC